MNNELGILLCIVWLLPLLLSLHGLRPRDKLLLLVTATTVGGIWLGYQKFAAFVVPEAAEARPAVGLLGVVSRTLQIGFTPKLWMLSHIVRTHPLMFAALFLVATLILFWLWRAGKQHRQLHQPMVVVSVVAVGLAICNLFGLIAVGLFLLLIWKGKGVRELANLSYCRWVAFELAAIFAFWTLYGLIIWKGAGLPLSSETELVKKILKDCLYYPAMHANLYLEAFPLMTAVVALGTLYWGFLFHTGIRTSQKEAMLFPAFWLPLLALGFKQEWIYLRYTVVLYPIYLMLFAWTLDRGLSWLWAGLTRSNKDASVLKRSYLCTGVLTALILAVPVLRDHNLEAAIHTSQLSYRQPISPLWHGFPFHPDHQAPAEYVKARLRNNDIVVAVDLFQQYYYLGRVNYWLTGPSNAERYCYKKGNASYDIYTRTPAVTTKMALEDILSRARKSETASRIWLITSAELEGKSSGFFPDDWIETFSESNSSPAFIGRDDVTRVYLFDKSIESSH